ncbi:nucleoside triphosphate pyrophosphatase [Bacterioplanoides sp. SCSIO 12839]|uniref:Maf family protein n=1 Tax=Bacterioplanoides sp. SCSIO 12839 TaxID=2829569 RepID=UPI002102DB43|nr:nucleoside triphosphate pyrophosphatase [Bacterioplanoides sp. SCSIO 12839]UTW49130.1 septum formation inhibitor Maf [Bacterioplanoides sp. SCSIO 12839]
MTDFKLLLASSSPFRRQILNKLRIPFTCASPDIDETPLSAETPQQYVERLAIEKAQALANQYPEHWIIGSDQTSVLDGEIRGKPLTRDNAIRQLQQSSAKHVQFYTGLCLLNAASGQYVSMIEPFSVHFRELSTTEVERYIDLEQPLNCAGSFMVEGLGINLFEKLEGRDENSLIGLPLIGLLELMREAGLEPLGLAQ